VSYVQHQVLVSAPLIMRLVVPNLETGTLADSGYQGSTHAHAPYKKRRGGGLLDSEKDANRAHARLRVPGGQIGRDDVGSKSAVHPDGVPPGRHERAAGRRPSGRRVV
jgi:hypothetical protein